MRLDLSSSGEPEGDPTPVGWFRDHPVDWFSLSAEGRRAVVARETNRYRIVAVTPDPESPEGVPKLEPITDSFEGETWLPFVGPGGLGSAADGVDISSDGRWLLVPREVPGGSDLYKIPLGGGDAVRLTRSGLVYGGVWSPDSRFVAYLAPERDSTRLWLASADGRSSGRALGAFPWPEIFFGWKGARILFGGYDFQLQVIEDPEVEYGQEAATGWKPVEAKEGQAPTNTFVVRGESHPLVPEARLSEWEPGWKAATDSSIVSGSVMSRPLLSPNGEKVLFLWIRTTGPEPTGSWWWIYSPSERVHTPLVPRVDGEWPVGWTRDGTGIFWQAGRDLYLWPLGEEKSHLLTLPEGRIGCIPRPDTDAPEFICVQDESHVDLFLVDNFDPQM
jgi:hypothetical protein